MEQVTSTSKFEIQCKGCGAMLKFAPGTNHLKCEYCGGENEIKTAPFTIEEHDYHSALASGKQQNDMQEIKTVSCGSCGASTTLQPNIVSDECAFCGTPIVAKNATSKSILTPKSILPFKIEQKEAFANFRKWVSNLWFAPNKLKQYANNIEKLKGIYIPYWTYDCSTSTSYRGERGIKRQEVEHYTEEVNGRTVTKTRNVTVTDWYPASGTVHNSFDDILINASKSLPSNYAEKLEPWDLKSLVPFDVKYLSGFLAESYQIELEEGFEKAKVKTESTIRNTIEKDIGGDDQRIHNADTSYNNIKFKHTLLPIWISAYRYNGKTYRFMINGRTGEVQGERPYSWVKITLTVFGIAAAIGIVFAVFG